MDSLEADAKFSLRFGKVLRVNHDRIYAALL